jgi:hypothetical protein
VHPDAEDDSPTLQHTFNSREKNLKRGHHHQLTWHQHVTGQQIFRRHQKEKRISNNSATFDHFRVEQTNKQQQQQQQHVTYIAQSL